MEYTSYAYKTIMTPCERQRSWQSSYQVLLTQPVELLELLRHEQLSAPYCTPYLAQDWNTTRITSSTPLRLQYAAQWKKRLPWDDMYVALSATLTFLRQIVLLRLRLHLLTPALDPLGVCVKELHEPAPVPPQGGGHPARLACRGCALPRGRRFQLPGGLTGGLPGAWGFDRGTVILAVAKEPLGAYGSHCTVLGGRAGLRVALEAPAELKALVLHDREALQLHVSLHSRSHAVWALEPALSVREKAIVFTHGRYKQRQQKSKVEVF